MPCFLTECSQEEELKRFLVAFVGVYAYHFVWDKLVISPIVDYCVRHRYAAKDKRDKMRESMWKNAAVGSFFTLGVYIGHDQDWFMNPHGYFAVWPYVAPEPLRWYYMIYLSFWLQSVDFMLNLTNNHYLVKRKDNAEMLVHHFATVALMVFSYFTDFTRIGMCVLLIHDVNDLILETAKLFLYLEQETLSNITFGIFAITWFIVRWYFYATNIVASVYWDAHEKLLMPVLEAGSFAGLPGTVWWWAWAIFGGFIALLLVLHIFWGVLIVKMVLRSLRSGNVEKDIRSDSEDDEEEDHAEDKKKVKKTSEAAAVPPPSEGKTRRRRAPKAE